MDYRQTFYRQSLWAVYAQDYSDGRSLCFSSAQRRKHQHQMIYRLWSTFMILRSLLGLNSGTDVLCRLPLYRQMIFLTCIPHSSLFCHYLLNCTLYITLKVRWAILEKDNWLLIPRLSNTNKRVFTVNMSKVKLILSLTLFIKLDQFFVNNIDYSSKK